MLILRAAFWYFGIVFGAGFVLGPIRILLLAPSLGDRVSELLELPIMLLVAVLAARWIVLRFQLVKRRPMKAGMIGGLAFIMMLVAEFGMVLNLQGITVRDYIALRDPVAGVAYYVMLLVFAAMPWGISQHMATSREEKPLQQPPEPKP